MELQQLRYLVSVVKNQSFTRAAHECHVSQPTLSHQIKKLEEEIGEPLLQRFKKGAFPTPLGQRIHAHATRVLGIMELARQEVASGAGEVQGELRIGIIPTVAPYYLPRLLGACHKRYPGISLEITEAPTENLLLDLRRGALDLAILSPPVAGDDLLFQHLFEDELLLALPPAHPLCRVKAIELSRLKPFPLIVMSEAHCLRGQTLSLCDRAGFTPKVFLQSAQLDTILAMVETGLGISFVPALAKTQARLRKVVFRSLGPQKLYRKVALAWQKQLTLTRAFAAFLKLCESGRLAGTHGVKKK